MHLLWDTDMFFTKRPFETPLPKSKTHPVKDVCFERLISSLQNDYSEFRYISGENVSCLQSIFTIAPG